MQRRATTFSGRVQGVGFRVTTVDVAAGFALTGWVRNEPDGTVRCEAQGRADELDRFLDSLQSRMARYIVAEYTEPIPIVPDESGFGIRH